MPPQYPYIDETPTDPPSGNYFAYRPGTGEEGFSRPMSGQCESFKSINQWLKFLVEIAKSELTICTAQNTETQIPKKKKVRKGVILLKPAASASLSSQ